MAVKESNGVPMSTQIWHRLVNFGTNGIKSAGAHIDDLRSVIGANLDCNIAAGQTYKIGGVPFVGGLPAASSAEVATGTSSTVAMTPSTNQKITIIQDQKANTVSGGTFTTGAWKTRDLNTYQVNQIGIAALSSNQFVLPAGTYEFDIACAGTGIDANQCKLYNITDAADALIGNFNYAVALNGPTALCFGVITITGNKTFEIRHYCETTNATVGFGRAAPFTVAYNVYTTVTIRKVA